MPHAVPSDCALLLLLLLHVILKLLQFPLLPPQLQSREFPSLRCIFRDIAHCSGITDRFRTTLWSNARSRVCQLADPFDHSVASVVAGFLLLLLLLLGVLAHAGRDCPLHLASGTILPKAFALPEECQQPVSKAARCCVVESKRLDVWLVLLAMCAAGPFPTE